MYIRKIKVMKNNIFHLSGGPEAKKTFLHSDLLDIDLEGVGDTPWRSAWEKSFGEQQLFNQMVVSISFHPDFTLILS